MTSKNSTKRVREIGYPYLTPLDGVNELKREPFMRKEKVGVLCIEISCGYAKEYVKEYAKEKTVLLYHIF